MGKGGYRLRKMSMSQRLRNEAIINCWNDKKKLVLFGKKFKANKYLPSIILMQLEIGNGLRHYRAFPIAKKITKPCQITKTKYKTLIQQYIKQNGESVII